MRQLRDERTAAERDLAGARELLQRVELERAEAKLRLETAVEALRRELECEPDEAVAAPCPELPPGIPAQARVRELDRELRLMGPVNPLALEELAALEERDRFLAEQLEDVRNARRELGRVIRAVDEEIVGVFAEAFADVARHFEELFSMLFPGGTRQPQPRRARGPALDRGRDRGAAGRPQRPPPVAALGRASGRSSPWRSCSPCSAAARRPSI